MPISMPLVRILFVRRPIVALLSLSVVLILVAGCQPAATPTPSAPVSIFSPSITPPPNADPTEPLPTGFLTETPISAPNISASNTPDPALIATQTLIAQEISTMTGGTPQPTAGMFRPDVGVISTATTPDPNIQLLFDSVTLEQRIGGQDTPVLTVIVRRDGSVQRSDAQAASVGEFGVLELDALLDEVDFFGFQGFFVSAGNAGSTIYRITVERAGFTRSVDLQEGLAPPELQQLVAIMQYAGLNVPGQRTLGQPTPVLNP
jgi:hypothetical protein